jgi:hypothetical protein
MFDQKLDPKLIAKSLNVAVQTVRGWLTCSPISDPRVMRVFQPHKGKEILDECSSQEASFARADHRASA